MPHFFLQFCIVATILYSMQQNACAVQWKPLNSTSRYTVAYDEKSVRLNSLGRLEIWLRFIPQGENKRKLAAEEYKEKRYRLHLEYYEIDCSEQTATLGLIDIIGPSRARLKRLQGSTQSEPILPGSVLDSAAEHICPVLDDDTEETNETEESGQSMGDDVHVDKSLSNDTVLLIEKLKKETASKEATADMWRALGNIYFDTDQSEQAIEAYDHALSLRPNDTDILNDQGAMYRQTGDFERALANFEKANSVDPHNLESIYNSGYVYAFDLNNIPKALVMWRRYLELDSKSETGQQVQSFIDQYGK